MLYDGSTFDRNGRTFIFRTEWDSDAGAPWEEHDGHGIVSEWTKRDKAPGERVLASNRSSKRYYDVQATMALARKDAWGLSDESKAKLAKRLGREPTRGEIVAEAVERDFQYLRRWCSDQWNWIGVIVEHAESGESRSLWRIESDDYAYQEVIANELADEISYKLDGQMACEIAESRPDMRPTY